MLKRFLVDTVYVHMYVCTYAVSTRIVRTFSFMLIFITGHFVCSGGCCF